MIGKVPYIMGLIISLLLVSLSPVVIEAEEENPLTDKKSDMDIQQNNSTRSTHNFDKGVVFDPIMRVGCFNGIDFDISPNKKYIAIRTPIRILIFNISTRFVKDEIECDSPSYVKYISDTMLKIYYNDKMLDCTPASGHLVKL